MFRLQEIIHAERPDVVVETGVAHGGSLVFYASLFEAMGHGRVIGIDIDIRPPNRAAIEAHPMASRIALIEGSSTSPEVLRRLDELIVPDERVLVVLDSNHGRDHVLAELRAYARFLQVGGRMVAADGIMQDLPGKRRVTLSPRTTASSSTSPNGCSTKARHGNESPTGRIAT